MRQDCRMRYLTMLLLLTSSTIVYSQQTTFNAEFAPSSPAVTWPERDFRQALSLNGYWQFRPQENAEQLKKEEIKNPKYPDSEGWESTPVKVPSPWNVNNFATEDIAGGDYVAYPSYPKKWEQIRAGWLMRKLAYRREWKNKRLILHFESVGGFCQVYLNKKKIAENFDVFLPFEVDVTGKLEADRENELSVWIADGKLFDEPGKVGRRVFVGGSFWGQHVRGIWQDVNLLIKPGVFVSETFIQPNVDHDTLAVAVTVHNTTGTARQVNLTGDIFPWINLAGQSTLEAPEVKWKLGAKVAELEFNNVTIPAHGQKNVTLKLKVNGKLKLWSSDAPNLYGLVITPSEKGMPLDKKYTRFGWRQFQVVKDKLMLNGKPIVLKGDSWHFMGIPQMTRRYAWAWYTALKDVNANAVRLHAQPYPTFYLDMADEMGICVLDETGLWASDGGPKMDSEEYWSRSEDHLRRLILRDKNHASVFGWSVCNENMAVAIDVFNAPDETIKRQIAEINKWITITRQLDPTRNWISGDGETNRPTDLPTVVGHYGGINEYKKWSSTGKPWGIGEAGMAYYGTPKQTSEYNGVRSYRSQQGRMEGVAQEAAQLLYQQRKYQASYRSIFNLVWYGLKPLELGLADTTRKPIASDGVFFGKYIEGKDGVQPERLGPYTTTLNPGYDPALPLYRTWPLFDAIKNGFDDSAPDSGHNKPLALPKKNHTLKRRNLILLSADPDSTLGRIFKEMGFSINKESSDVSELLVIDGLFPGTVSTALSIKDQVEKKGGIVLVWGISEQSRPAINRLLPVPISLTRRTSTSFLISGNNPILDNLSDADFYFSELSETPVSFHGIENKLIGDREILLKASNTDWTTWNKRAEYLKTAAILRSERESKPGGNALVYIPGAGSGTYIMALDPRTMYNSSPAIVGAILGNLGVIVNTPVQSQRNNIGYEGFIEKALFAGPFEQNENERKHAYPTDFLSGADSTAFRPGESVKDKAWKLTHTGAEHALNPLDPKGKNLDVAYYTFWLYSPRSLSNLLLEPDMPKIDVLIRSANPTILYLNGRPLTGKIMDNKETKFATIPLEKGWNLIKVRCIKASEDWKVAVRLASDDRNFLNRDVKAEPFR